MLCFHYIFEFIFSAKSEGWRTIRLRMGHDISSKQHNKPIDCSRNGVHAVARLIMQSFRVEKTMFFLHKESLLFTD